MQRCAQATMVKWPEDVRRLQLPVEIGITVLNNFERYPVQGKRNMLTLYVLVGGKEEAIHVADETGL